MSFIYPRTVAIRRSRTNAGRPGAPQQVGLVGYSGREQTTSRSDAEGEDVLYTDLPASVQARRANARNPKLASDTADKPAWLIFIPNSAGLPIYAIRDNDIVVDDEGYRYMVAQNYWTPLGYQLNCIRMEA